MKKMMIVLLLLCQLFALTSCNGGNDTASDRETTPTIADGMTDSPSDGTPQAPSDGTTSADETTSNDVTTAPELPVEPVETLLTVAYEIGTIASATGQNSSNVKRFRTVDFIPLADMEAISVGSGYCLIWFAYDRDYHYLGNGTNTYPTLPSYGIWPAEGKDVTKADILEWNESSAYFRFAVKTVTDAAIGDADIALSRVKVYGSGYPGELDFVAPPLETVATVAGGRQDGDVYGGYLFSFNAAGTCQVYSADTYQPISDFTLDRLGVLKPHANSVCFGSFRYEESDEFPLLYCNVYNNYRNDRSYDGMCNVYRIQREGNVFTSTLVQVIKIGFTDDSETWSSPNGDARPFGNFVVDTDNNRLYAFTMRDESQTTRFFSFRLPTVHDGTLDSTLGVRKVTLLADDIIDTFDTEYFHYIQGVTYDHGKIYSLEGFTNDATNPAALKVVDLSTKTVCRTIDLYGMNLKIEPEAVYCIDGIGYYIDVSGNVYTFPMN